MALNIGQSMTREEVLEGVDDPLWFAAYSCTLQQVGEATYGWRWEWPVGKTPEVGMSPLVQAFWEETGIELATSCMKLCWELPPRGVFRRRERGPIAYAITFVDDIAVRVPSLNAWDQFVWPLAVTMQRATTEAEQYGYRRTQVVDLGPIMPVTQFRVTDEAGMYLCVARALVFKGSVLAYNPPRDEAEWVPTRSVTQLGGEVSRGIGELCAMHFPRGGLHCKARGPLPCELARQLLLTGGGGRGTQGSGGTGRSCTIPVPVIVLYLYCTLYQ